MCMFYVDINVWLSIHNTGTVNDKVSLISLNKMIE